MVLAVSVHHPVFSVGADLQLEGGDVVGLLSLLRNGPLCGDACQNLQELEVNLGREKKEMIKKNSLDENRKLRENKSNGTEQCGWM